MSENLTKTPLSSSRFTMDEFDALPPMVRRALADCPYNIHPSTAQMNNIHEHEGRKFIERLAKVTPKLIRDSAFMVYGPDHPQAK